MYVQFAVRSLPVSVFVPDGVELLERDEEVVGGLVDEVGVSAGVAGVAEARAHRVVHVQHAGVAVPALSDSLLLSSPDT